MEKYLYDNLKRKRNSFIGSTFIIDYLTLVRGQRQFMREELFDEMCTIYGWYLF